MSFPPAIMRRNGGSTIFNELERQMRMILKSGLVAALALGFSAGAFALDHHGDKKHKMKDPMARAEMQCENAKTEAAEGTDEDKAKAEEKCTKAMAKGKEKAEKMAHKAEMKAEKKAMKGKDKAEKMKKEKKGKKDKDDDGTK